MKYNKFRIARSGDSSSSSSSSNESDDHEDGEIEDSEKSKPLRKSRVDPKDIPEVSNKFLMRSAPSRDATAKESDSEDKTSKHGKIDRDRKDSDNRGRANDAKGYVFRFNTENKIRKLLQFNDLFIDLDGQSGMYHCHVAVASSKAEEYS